MGKYRKRAPKQARPSLCVGCGSDAVGYNYEAPSCYSCKSFFRRTVLEEKVLPVCMKKGLCSIEGATIQCRACRFGKCVRGGMNPLLITNIVNPEANAVVRRFYGSPSHSDEPCSSNDAELQRQNIPPLVANPARIENSLERMMLELLSLEDAHQQLRMSTYCPKLVAGVRLDDFISGSSKLGGKMTRMLSQSYEPASRHLFPEEAVIKYGMPSMDLRKFDYTKRKLWFFQDVFYALEFIKALPVYSLLDNGSKSVLLASALSCCNFTAAYFSYSVKSDRTCYPDGSTMSWSREMQDAAPDSTRFNTALIAAMREMRLDKREYTLLKMMIVCNPMLSGLSQPGITLLQHEKERCTKTLFSYVLARRGVGEGPALLAKLLSIIDLEMRLTSWQKSQHILIMAMGFHKHPMQLAEAIFHSH